MNREDVECAEYKFNDAREVLKRYNETKGWHDRKEHALTGEVLDAMAVICLHLTNNTRAE